MRIYSLPWYHLRDALWHLRCAQSGEQDNGTPATPKNLQTTPSSNSMHIDIKRLIVEPQVSRRRWKFDPEVVRRYDCRHIKMWPGRYNTRSALAPLPSAGPRVAPRTCRFSSRTLSKNDDSCSAQIFCYYPRHAVSPRPWARLRGSSWDRKCGAVSRS
jgi:hypothetical protein